MKVAILGAGAIAYGNAALRRRDGHDVTLWSPSADAPRRLPRVRRWWRAVPSRAAFIRASPQAVPTRCRARRPWWWRCRVTDIAPCSTPRRRFCAQQVVVFSSHMSLAALYLAGLLSKRGVATPIAALGTTVTTGRQAGPDAVNVSSIRARLDVAVLPEAAASRGIEVCRALFGDRFVPRDGLLAIALSNLNPQNHLAIALCNLTRMELGEGMGAEPPHHARGRPADRGARRRAPGDRPGLRPHGAHHPRTFPSVVRRADGPARRDDACAGATLHGRERPDHARQPLRHRRRAVRPGADDRLAALAGVPVPLHESGVRLMSALYGLTLPRRTTSCRASYCCRARCWPGRAEQFRAVPTCRLPLLEPRSEHDFERPGRPAPRPPHFGCVGTSPSCCMIARLSIRFSGLRRCWPSRVEPMHIPECRLDLAGGWVQRPSPSLACVAVVVHRPATQSSSATACSTTIARFPASSRASTTGTARCARAPARRRATCTVMVRARRSSCSRPCPCRLKAALAFR